MSPAYPARIVAKLLTRDRALMSDYKQGCRDGTVQAIQHNGQNWVVITDEGLRGRLEATDPKLPRLQYDEESGQVEP